MPSLLQFLRRTVAPHRSRCWSIIGTLGVLLVLGGCGATRVVYNNAPSLSYWWLDGFLDFDTAQTLRVRTDLDAAHAWHRKEELPLVAADLANLKARALQNVTPEQVCKIAADAQTRAQAPLKRLAPTLAAIAPSLNDAQLQHLQREFDKRNRVWREDYVDGPPSERTDQRLKQATERAESFYGRLRPEQLTWLRAQLMANDYDASLQYREQLRRQQDALQVLRQMRSGAGGPSTPAPPATPIPTEVATPGLQSVLALLERSVVSPDANYRAYQVRLLQQGCATVAELHNSMTPQQRAKLLATLQNYDLDIRTLMAVR